MSSSRVLAAVICLGLWTAPAWAEVINGTLKSIDVEGRTLELENAKGEATSYPLPDTAKFYMMTKPAKIDALEEGQSLAVTTDKAGKVTVVRVKKASSQPRAASKASGGGSKATGTGWAQYGGPNRDNRSTETGLLKSWPASGPEMVGNGRGLGMGFSTVTFSDGKILTMGSRGDDEFVICLDEKNLSEVWSARIGRTRPDGMGADRGERRRSMATAFTPSAPTATWHASSLMTGLPSGAETSSRRSGAQNITWGISESPLIDGDKVIVTPGAQGRASSPSTRTAEN